MEQQLLNKIDGQELKEESDDNNKAKGFDFVMGSQKSKVKVGKKELRKEKNLAKVCEKKKKAVKKTGAS